MRRWVVLFLLVLLPLQFVWGAAATYCGHEQGSGIVHFGHHVTPHHAKVGVGNNEAAPDHQGGMTADDFDCGFCHLSHAHPLIPSVQIVLALAWHAPVAAEEPQPPQDVLSPRIDKPNWTLAV